MQVCSRNHKNGLIASTATILKHSGTHTTLQSITVHTQLTKCIIISTYTCTLSLKLYVHVNYGIISGNFKSQAYHVTNSAYVAIVKDTVIVTVTIMIMIDFHSCILSQTNCHVNEMIHLYTKFVYCSSIITKLPIA